MQLWILLVPVNSTVLFQPPIIRSDSFQNNALPHCQNFVASTMSGSCRSKFSVFAGWFHQDQSPKYNMVDSPPLFFSKRVHEFLCTRFSPNSAHCRLHSVKAPTPLSMTPSIFNGARIVKCSSAYTYLSLSDIQISSTCVV